MATPVFDTILAAIAPVQEAMNAIVDSIKEVVSVMKDFVGSFRPYEIQRFQRAIVDLKAVIGEIVLPVFQKMVYVVREVGTYLYSLPASFKEVIRWMADWIVKLGFLGKILAYLNSLEGGNKFFKTLLRLFEETFQAILNAGAAIKSYLGPTWQEFANAISELGKSISEALVLIKPFVAAIITNLARALAVAAVSFVSAITQTVNVLNWAVRNIDALLKFAVPAIGLLKQSLPDLERPETSNFGKGAFGDTGLTTTMELYRTIQARLLQSGGASEEVNKIKLGTNDIKKNQEIQIAQQDKANTTLNLLEGAIQAIAGRRIARGILH